MNSDEAVREEGTSILNRQGLNLNTAYGGRDRCPVAASDDGGDGLTSIDNGYCTKLIQELMRRTE
jgi:hypothetical protein